MKNEVPLPTFTEGSLTTTKIYPSISNDLVTGQVTKSYSVSIKGRKYELSKLKLKLKDKTDYIECPQWFLDAIQLYSNTDNPRSFKQYIEKTSKAAKEYEVSLKAKPQYGLRREATRQPNRWKHDFDYVDTLSDKDREWLNQFARGFYQNTFDDSNFGPGAQRPFKTTEQKRLIFNEFNAAARDLFSNPDTELLSIVDDLGEDEHEVLISNYCRFETLSEKAVQEWETKTKQRVKELKAAKIAKTLKSKRKPQRNSQ